MVFISPFLVPKGFVGITLYPFIILKSNKLKEDKVLLNHEKIHLRQQAELLVVFFYFFYMLEWLVKLVRYRDRRKAYYNISFEKEAYRNEGDEVYLKTRSMWTFLKYI